MGRMQLTQVRASEHTACMSASLNPAGLRGCTHGTAWSTEHLQARTPALQEHLTGKQYLGWKIIREKYGELQRKYELGGLGAAPREPAAADDRERERDRDRPRSSSRPLDDTRSGSRGDRDRERERERSPRCVVGWLAGHKRARGRASAAGTLCREFFLKGGVLLLFGVWMLLWPNMPCA